jgi:hypothetical protein
MDLAAAALARLSPSDKTAAAAHAMARPGAAAWSPDAAPARQLQFRGPF